MKKKTAYIVSTTHWDREWYWSQEKFRIRLVELIDSLLEIFKKEPGYKYYMMDGQTIPLEDYLEIKPWKKDEICKLVKNGKLLIGPWYILPDVFLVSGEALIRNLLIGNKTAMEYGNIMNAGYLPDTFNQIDQMPQIMKGFNFSEFMFMRGMGKQFEKLGTEFWWEAPDSTKVYTLYLIEGYFNAGGMGFHDPFIDFRDMIPDKEMAFEKMKVMMDKMEKHYPKSNVFLMFNGSDHTTPQKELPELLEYLNEKFPDIEFKHSTIRDFFDNAYPEKKDLPVYKGEFTENYHHLDVKSVYSTRMYMKQENFKSQALLEKYAEPITSITLSEGLNDFKANIEYAWKLLLKNHPHDSISGCSIDEVHRDMMNRYERLQQVAGYCKEKSLLSLSKLINTESKNGIPVLVYNPMTWERKETVRVKVRLGDKNIKRTSYTLKDSCNKEIPFSIIREFEDYSPELNNWKYFKAIEIEFTAKIPSMGYSVYYLCEGSELKIKSGIKATKNTLENDIYKVAVNANGSLKITDKRSKTVYSDFNMFEDTEDDGDEYTYSFVESSKTFTTKSAKAKVSIYEHNINSASLKVEIDFKIPEKLHQSRTKRSSKLINNRITSYITLSDNDRIDIKTEIENKSLDHRLRVLFPTGYKDYKNYADGHFDVVKRDKYFPEKPTEREKKEYYSTQHESNFVTMTDDKNAITLANKGLPEYEILKEKSALAITLLRCVGYLNKNKIMTRWRMAGPDIATPEAQCTGKNVFEYSIILHSKSWENSFKSANNFCYPLDSLMVQKNQGSLPDTMSFIKIHPDKMMLSTFKAAEDKNGNILRIYNPYSKDEDGIIIYYKDIKKCFLTNLLEENIEEIPSEGNKIKIKIPQNKIITLKIIQE
jgi:mannosylglycerate hydrolase